MLFHPGGGILTTDTKNEQTRSGRLQYRNCWLWRRRDRKRWAFHVCAVFLRALWMFLLTSFKRKIVQTWIYDDLCLSTHISVSFLFFAHSCVFDIMFFLPRLEKQCCFDFKTLSWYQYWTFLSISGYSWQLSPNSHTNFDQKKNWYILIQRLIHHHPKKNLRTFDGLEIAGPEELPSTIIHEHLGKSWSNMEQLGPTEQFHTNN